MFSFPPWTLCGRLKQTAESNIAWLCIKFWKCPPSSNLWHCGSIIPQIYWMPPEMPSLPKFFMLRDDMVNKCHKQNTGVMKWYKIPHKCAFPLATSEQIVEYYYHTSMFCHAFYIVAESHFNLLLYKSRPLSLCGLNFLLFILCWKR